MKIEVDVELPIGENGTFGDYIAAEVAERLASELRKAVGEEVIKAVQHSIALQVSGIVTAKMTEPLTITDTWGTKHGETTIRDMALKQVKDYMEATVNLKTGAENRYSDDPKGTRLQWLITKTCQEAIADQVLAVKRELAAAVRIATTEKMAEIVAAAIAPKK